MATTNRLPYQQDAREDLEDQICDWHKHCVMTGNTALSHALTAGELLLEVIEKYRKREYGGKTALFERTCGAAKTGRTYVFLAKHRDLLEGKPAETSAGFGGYSIASALEYIRKQLGSSRPKPEAPAPITPVPSPPEMPAQDSTSAEEIRRLTERIAELEQDLTPAQLRTQLERLGLERFRTEVLPPDWVKPLVDNAVSQASPPDKLISMIERHIPTKNRAAHRSLTRVAQSINKSITIDGTYKVH